MFICGGGRNRPDVHEKPMCLLVALLYDEDIYLFILDGNNNTDNIIFPVFSRKRVGQHRLFREKKRKQWNEPTF